MTDEQTPTSGMSDEDVIKRMDEATARLDDANRRLRAEMVLMEEMKIKSLLGGQSLGGVPEKVETEREYALRMLRGGQ